ncbi:hypothetical protein HS053_09500 [Tabrizicola sp. SY72]|nr:hypothetical protein [Tabrizicola sp. SY72]
MTQGPTLCRLRAAMWRLPVLLALVVLAVLPPGVMPRQNDDGGLVMVICAGQGTVQMVLDPETGEMRPKAPDAERAACGWAMAQAVPDLVQPFTLSAPTQLARAVTPATASVVWWPAHDPRGLYARGPPSLT